MLIGTPIKDVSQHLEFEIKPIIAQEISNYEKVYNIFYNAFTDFVDENANVTVSGKAKVLEQPEYDNPDSIKNLHINLRMSHSLRKLQVLMVVMKLRFI